MHEARLRGLDITSLGNSDNKNSTHFMLGEHFEKAWINPKTEKVPNITTISGDNLVIRALKQMQGYERYNIGINYNKQDGHIITAERTEHGKLLLYNAQSGLF